MLDDLTNSELLNTFLHLRDMYRTEYGDYIPNIEQDMQNMHNEILRRMER